MKMLTKRLITFALCIVFSAVFCLFSSALSTNEYGLGLSVSTEEFDNKTHVSITLNNANDFDVSEISINHNIPQGLALQSSTEHSMLVSTLSAGGTYEAELVFADLSTPLSPSSAEVSNEAERINPIAAAIFAAAITAVIVIAIIISRRNKKAAAMLMAVILMLPVLSLYGVHAFGIGDMRSFTLEDSITVGGKSYPLSITVSYLASTAKDSYFEIETTPDAKTADGKTVTRPTADFSGTAAAKETVKTVTYEVRSEIDGYDVGSNGEAVLDGCSWSVDNLKLKSGENEITFTATLENGSTQVYTQTLNYDRGETYKRTKAEEAEEGRTKYVKEIVNIYFDSSTTDERIEEILGEINAERAGEINDIVMVQARVEAENLTALEAKCEEIEKYDEVLLAGIEEILPLEIDATTNDPWSAYTSHNETVNEEIPGGYNWHAEAIQAHSAWNYDKYYSNVKVGVIDGPIMTDHEDIEGLISFTNSSYKADNVLSSVPNTLKDQYHGTHVSSIIGATPNNGIGISGLLWDVDIYAANFSSTAASMDTLSYVLGAISSQVINGAKAVNLSLGLSNSIKADDPTYNPYLNQYTDNDLRYTTAQCAVGMHSLLEDNEFVIVQSAGNGTVDTRLGVNVVRSVDAVTNGLFCSIRNNTTYGNLTLAQVKEVYNRVIVVGAATNQSNNANGLLFEMSYFSNAGERVDIYAPGYKVLGAVTPQPDSNDNYTIIYGSASGTSQAAPMVTAVAALCFAINPNFTGAEVKNLIKENTRCDVYDYELFQKGTDGELYNIHPLTGDGKMLSMKLVAEAALRTVCGKANYRYLNQIVAAAQSLNPDEYTNYEIVQEVLDSIDYNLYEFQQDEVTAKANELVAAMDKLKEKIPADYTKVEEAKAKANELDPDDYVDFSGVTEAVKAVVYGKYSDEQTAVNQMAQDILDAIEALEFNASISTYDPNIIADNLGKYIVLTADYLGSYTDMLSAGGGYTLTVSPSSSGTYSTGATVTLSKEGYDDIVYTVAVLGDIDGNGKSDANDAFLARMYALGMLSAPSGIYFIASDANCDGSVTEDDSMLIQNSTIYNDMIFNDYVAGSVA